MYVQNNMNDINIARSPKWVNYEKKKNNSEILSFTEDLDFLRLNFLRC